MSAIHGFPADFKVISVNSELILEKNDLTRLEYRFSGASVGDLLYKIPDSIETHLTDNLETVRLKGVIPLNQVELQEKDSLYIHSNCTLPRASLKDKYKRVLKVEKAKACVVPMIDTNCLVNTYAIFVNEETKRIYVFTPRTYYNHIKNKWEIILPTICETAEKGSRLKDINPDIVSFTIPENYVRYYDRECPSTKDFLKSLIESKLVDYGKYMIIDKSKSFIVDYLEGNIHDLVTEGYISASLGTAENQLNEDAINSIKTLITSSAPDVVGLGLKTLAEMDYPKYKNSTAFLLTTTWNFWASNPIKNSASVKYMLKYLKLEHGPRFCYDEDITDEDFSLLKHVVSSKIIDSINQIKEEISKTFPFAKIDLDVTNTVTKK